MGWGLPRLICCGWKQSRDTCASSNENAGSPSDIRGTGELLYDYGMRSDAEAHHPTVARSPAIVPGTGMKRLRQTTCCRKWRQACNSQEEELPADSPQCNSRIRAVM